VRKAVPDVMLKIVGDGELRPFYEAEVRRLKLQKNVKFVGKFPQHKLASLYAGSSVFVLPSKGLEGHANVVLEALACGTPVVVSNVVGMATDITTHGCGKVVRPNQPAELAAAIKAVLLDVAGRKQMKKNAAKLIEDNYHWPVVAARVQAEYQKLLEA
jgi:glycosyltransferase involved in cell wall biosynthesis